MAKKTCNCIELTNEALAEFDAELVTVPTFNFETHESGIAGPFLQARRTGDGKKGGKLPSIACKFCPVCGVQLLFDD